MKKYTKLSLALLISGNLLAQTNDNISYKSGYTNSVYYSLEYGEIATSKTSDWDLAVAIYSTQTASIIINGGFGTELYQYTAGDTSDWKSLDTVGLYSSSRYKQCFDTDTSHYLSAFEYNSSGHPNYGWGMYNSITHNVIGTSLFVLKTQLGKYKKVWIVEQQAMQQTTTIKTSDLDNSNEKTLLIDRKVPNRNYLYVDIEANTVEDLEPSNQSYDLIFTKYLGDFGTFTYPVSGVLSNIGISVAESRGIDIAEADMNANPFSKRMNVIGSDWKSFNNSSFQYDLTDSLSFFIEDKASNVWHLWFTSFEGSSTGNVEFVKQKVLSTSVSNDLLESKLNVLVFPNPANETLKINLPNEKTFTVELISVTGKTIMHSENLKGKLRLDASGFDSGIYLLKVKNSEFTSIQKIVLQ